MKFQKLTAILHHSIKKNIQILKLYFLNLYLQNPNKAFY
jgi:hypothetical protein